MSESDPTLMADVPAISIGALDTTPVKAPHTDTAADDQDGDSTTVQRTMSAKGSVRIGASPPTRSPSQIAKAAKAQEAKRLIQQQLAELQNKLKEFEPSASPPAPAAEPVVAAESTTAMADVAPPAAAASAIDLTSDNAMTDVPSSSIVTASKQNASKPKKDSSEKKDASSSEKKPTRKRKSKEPATAATASVASLFAAPAIAAAASSSSSAAVSAAPTQTPEAVAMDVSKPEESSLAAVTSTTDAPAAAAPSTDAIAIVAQPAASVAGAAAVESSDIVAPAPKKARASTSGSKKETPEEKAAQKAAKEAELAAKKAEKAAEAEAKKEAHRREMEAKKAERAAEAEAKKEAHRREVEEKKAEKQREVDAKKAEKDAAKTEKQREAEAKKAEKDAAARAAEAEKEAKKKSLEKSKGVLASFFGLKTTPPTSAEKNKEKSSDSKAAATTPAAAPAAMDTSSSSSHSAAAAASSSAPSSGSHGASTSSSSAGAPSDRRSGLFGPCGESSTKFDRSAVFLPYAKDPRGVWTEEHARMSTTERAALAAELESSLDLDATGGAQPDKILDWKEDKERIEQARARAVKRRQRAVMIASQPPQPTSDRKKLVQFHDNYRPAWYGKVRKSLAGEIPATGVAAPAVAAAAAPAASAAASFLPLPRCRRPCSRWTLPSSSVLQYDVDSDDEWGEEPDDGEVLDSEESEDEEEEEEEEVDAADGSKKKKKIRGLDGYESDDFLAPEEEDYLAQQLLSEKKQAEAGGKNGKSGKHAATKGKGKQKQREADMLPIIVGPVLDLDRTVKRYYAEQAKLQQDPTFVPTVVLTEEMKELLMFKKRFLAPRPIDFDSTYSWRMPSADALAAVPPQLRTPATADTRKSPLKQASLPVHPVKMEIDSFVFEETVTAGVEVDADLKLESLVPRKLEEEPLAIPHGGPTPMEIEW